jgi:uncharacterized membrane protein
MVSSRRLGYVDWARGLAVYVMIQTHTYSSWLSPQAKQTRFWHRVELVGGYGAPLFLFLAGMGLALKAERLLAGGQPASGVLRAGVRRGLEVFLYAVLFRLWMYASGRFSAPRELLRVDVLNCIGLSLILVAAVVVPWTSRPRRMWAAVGLCAAIALLTPLAWDAPWPGWIPRPLLAYVSGRGWGSYFPIFPWAGFTAAGAAVALLIDQARDPRREPLTMAALTAGGAGLIPLSLFVDRVSPSVYPVYDFWWTSPSYFLVKTGVLLLVLGFAYAWDRVPGWSPLRQMGRASLLIYWVHIEIVYGGNVLRWAHGTLDLAEASIGLALLVLAMLLLSIVRTEGTRWLRGRRVAVAA